MNGKPMQKPWTAMTHGRGPSSWLTTTAEAVRFASKAIHRSPPGSPGCGAKPLSQVEPLVAEAHGPAWLVVTSSSVSGGGVRW